LSCHRQYQYTITRKKNISYLASSTMMKIEHSTVVIFGVTGLILTLLIRITTGFQISIPTQNYCNNVVLNTFSRKQKTEWRTKGTLLESQQRPKSIPIRAIWYDDDGPEKQANYREIQGSVPSIIPSKDSLSLSPSLVSSSSTSSSVIPYNIRTQHRDVVIVGGALAGLSAALYLSQIDPTRQITIFDRDDWSQKDSTKDGVASMAAAGMLAPSSERLPKGHLLDLCFASRRMYRDFCEMVETLAKESVGTEGEKYLTSPQNDDDKMKKDDSNNLPPWSVGYVASGGFLAPAFAGDSVATWAPPENDDGTPSSARWLDSMQVRELEPNLHPHVVGGWWFPEDASVDARRLTSSLRAACVGTGNIQLVPNCEVSSLDLSDGTCHGLWLQNGKYVKANTILVANGAWMRNLLPVPISPHKGQSLSLRMPLNQPPLLKRVLFAQDCYIVPKADGRIVVGATVEAGSYDPSVTPAGLMHIMSHALQLVPGLANLPIEETWAGLRPTTPDKGPILGATNWKNLFLAGGYWRNGVLLAPKTGYLLAMVMSGKQHNLSDKDLELLDAFAWDRFTSADKSATLTASSRYAASMYPVHTRSTQGVSVAVGTELGSYSTARSASAERAQDRGSLWSNNDSTNAENDAFERAATQGKNDGSAYTFGENPQGTSTISSSTTNSGDGDNTTEEEQDLTMDEKFPTFYEGSADAFTIASSTSGNYMASLEQPQRQQQQIQPKTDINSAYELIKANKAKFSPVVTQGEYVEDERPDPGFRIYHVDPETSEKRVVPPYTSPGDFLASLEKEKKASCSDTPPQPVSSLGSIQVTPYTNNDNSEDMNSALASSSRQNDETTYDGYQDIESANSRSSRADELQAMKDARRRNRLGQTEIDVSKIGVVDLSSP
jgi:glycine oxidase